VPYVLPGEEVRANAKSKKKKLIWAELLEVTSPRKSAKKQSALIFRNAEAATISTSLQRPLRAVSIAIRFRCMFHNRAIPRDSAEPRKRFAQNVSLEPQTAPLQGCADMAASAFLKMRRTLLFRALRGRSDPSQFGPDQFLLFSISRSPALLPRQNIRHENGITIGVCQPSPP